MTYLVDVNVWFALSYVAHVHYPIAKSWFEETEADQSALCRVTQSGLLRLLTNSTVMGADVLTAAKAWAINDDLCRDMRVIFAPEPSGLEIAWREATKQLHTGPNFWTDAYLAAFAKAGDYTIVYLRSRIPSPSRSVSPAAHARRLSLRQPLGRHAHQHWSKQ